MKPVSVRNVRYDAGNIACDVVWDEIEGEMPFIASGSDTVEHGKALYAAIMAGEYGPIGPEDPPSPEAIANSQRKAAQDAARDTIKGSPPPTTLPGVIERLDLIETLLGLK